MLEPKREICKRKDNLYEKMILGDQEMRKTKW